MPTVHGSHWKRQKDKISRVHESEGAGRAAGVAEEREEANMRGQDGQDGGWTDRARKEL